MTPDNDITAVEPTDDQLERWAADAPIYERPPDDWLEHQAAEAQAELSKPTPAPNGTSGNGNEPQPLTPQERMTAALLRGEEICDVPPPEPLVGGLLNTDSIALLYGRPGGGKSVLALDWAMSIATGSWWNGNEIATAGNALYILAEGVRGTGPRVKAWKSFHHYNASVPKGFVWLPMAVDLREAAWYGALGAIAADLAPALIVIDTLNRCAPGTDEGPADMGKVILAADHLRRSTGACVLIVHHSGKDQTAGARGHSSLLGAVDSELELKNGGDGILVLTVTKQKDGPDGQTYRLSMVPCENSVVITPYSGAVNDGDRIGATGLAVLEALGEVAMPGGVPNSVWWKACEGDVSERSYYRWRSRLLELGEVVNLGSHERARYALRDGAPADDEMEEEAS